MVPTLIEFDNPGSNAHVHNQATAMLNGYQKITLGEHTYEPKIMGIYPVAEGKLEPIVFDPPPMAA